MRLFLRNISTHRELILELTKRELLVGQSTHVLGRMWVLLNPLITLAVYFFLFTYVFPVRVGASNTPPEIFLLAGLIQWIVLSDLLVRSCNIIRNHSNLVKQTDFPVEILILKTILAGFFIQLIMSAGLFFIMVLQGNLSLAGMALWTVAFIIQFFFALGLAFLLASLTPFLSDLTELVGVFARIGLFIAPILYSADRFGPVLGKVFYANPYSYFTWIHQQALYNQTISDPVAWLGALILSIIAMGGGLYIYRQLSPAFMDVI